MSDNSLAGSLFQMNRQLQVGAASEQSILGHLGSDFEQGQNWASIQCQGPANPGPVYYLPDAGNIQFYLHDKPSEFYGTQACLVRNNTVKGVFVVRVQAKTPLCRIFQFRDMFESRQSARDRDIEYQRFGPYIHEREVGVNCGQSIPGGNEVTSAHLGPGLFYHGTPIIVKDGNGNGNVWVPFAGDKSNFPALIEKIQEYLEHTVDGLPIESREGSGEAESYTNETVTFTNDGTDDDLLADVVEYGTAGGELAKMLKDNSGGYGRGFTSSLVVPGERVNSPGGVYRTALHEQPIELLSHRSRLAGVSTEATSEEGNHPGATDDEVQAKPSVPGALRKPNPANANLPPRHLNKRTNTLYKTEMCRNWNEVGDCRYGRSCQFAHGQKELRVVARHGQWKTKTCMAWLHGGCTYGSRCCYAHEFVEDMGHAAATGTSNTGSGDPNSSSISPSTSTGSRFSDFFASRHLMNNNH